jgi:hypothetical protein
VPGTGNRIATRSDTGYVDAGPAGGYYKLSAVDVNGNESGYAVVTPSGTTAAPTLPLTFGLDAVRPTPWTGSDLTIAFTLTDARAARLELLDTSGRRILGRDVTALGVGRHTLALLDGGRLAPGLYLVRLSQGGEVRTRRVVVID